MQIELVKEKKYANEYLNHLAVCKVVLFMFKNKKWTVDKKLFTYFFSKYTVSTTVESILIRNGRT